MGGTDAGVVRDPEDVAADPGKGSAEDPVAAEWQMDVERGRVGVRCRQLPDLGHDALDDVGDPVEGRSRELAGRKVAACDLGAACLVWWQPREPRLEHPLTDPPLLQAVELDRQGVLELVAGAKEADVQPLAQERPHWVLDELDEVVELDDRPRRFAQLRREERRPCDPLARRRQRSVEVDLRVAPGFAVAKLSRREVAGIERLQRMPRHHRFGRRS